jgi:membrane associated rhomboid family serine protease
MTHDQSTISDKTSLLLFVISFIIANLNMVTDWAKAVAAIFAAVLAVAKFIEWIQTQINKRNEAKRKGGL